MGRLGILDGLRGYFLVFMFINHLYVTGGLALVRLNHAELGFVQDAQGFVFLSGFLVGLVYGRKLLKMGFRTAATALWSRALELYAYSIACVTVILILRGVLPRADEFWAVWLGGIGDGPLAFRLAGAALLYQPIYLDILPQYIVYFLVAPPLVWLCVRGHWLAVAVGSGLLWLAVQLGLHLPLAQAINAALGRFAPDLAMRIPFNVLGWQVVFFGGVVIGALWGAGQFDLKRIFDPRRPALAQASLAALALFMAIRLAFTFDLAPTVIYERFAHFEIRPEFGLVFLVNFVVLAYGFTWLLVAGPQSGSRVAQKLARALRALFALRFLRLLGRHSLQVYAWHVVVVYVVVWVDGLWGPFNQIEKTAIAVIGVAVLSLPAIVLDRRGSERPAIRAGEPRGESHVVSG